VCERRDVRDITDGVDAAGGAARFVDRNRAVIVEGHAGGLETEIGRARFAAGRDAEPLGRDRRAVIER
jgi:hypothetical protein